MNPEVIDQLRIVDDFEIDDLSSHRPKCLSCLDAARDQDQAHLEKVAYSYNLFV